MKLLLTSAGFTNKSIVDAFVELTGKRPEDTVLTFIPTASNVEKDDKGWLIDDLINIKKLNLKEVLITDISAVGEDIWRPQMEKADALFFEGGNNYHLMRWMNKSGLAEILPELLKTRVYVGSSAGSIVTAPDFAIQQLQIIYGKDVEGEPMDGLGFVDFYFTPHLNSAWFPRKTEENIKEMSKGITRKIYALDDQSALKIIDGNVEIISEGKYLELN